MKIVKSLTILSLIMIVLTNCRENWDEHYHSINEPTVNETVWEQLLKNPDYSIFTDFIVENELDSLFTSGKSLTVFVPVNEAFEGFNQDTSQLEVILRYHISETVFNTRNVQKSKKLETITKKFALIEKMDGQYYIDGVRINYSSPLCLDGRYYDINELLYPKPTLYEFISQNSGILKEYIDQFDSVYMDLTLSTPIGYDDEGNTIYDSVFNRINMFDSLFFPISTEFRQKTATFLLFDEEQYNNALDEMASDLGESFQSHTDIPEVWQLNVLLPVMVTNGIFEGSFQYADFCAGKLKNIAGDTVYVDCGNIDPYSRYIASNGVVFKYLDFSVPDSLYKGASKIQGEHMVDSIGAGVFNWKDWITVTGSNVTPLKQKAIGAEKDSIVSLDLGRRYSGNFSMEFYLRNLFPQRYRFEWRANYRPSGVYEIAVNDSVLGTFDLYKLRNSVISVTGERFIPQNGYNKFDFWVDNITEFGDAKITITYKGSGDVSFDGLTIDYIALIPE